MILRVSARNYVAVSMTNVPMGSGKNQRGEITMTPAEVDAFIEEQRTTTMSTIAPNGSIHSIAMWYGFLEGKIGIESKAKAQKVVNLRRNPNLTLCIEAGDTYDQLRGVTLIGRGDIVEDPERIWDLGVSVFERYNGPYTEEMKPFVETMLHKRVVVLLHVDRTISWDHRKLGLPAM